MSIRNYQDSLDVDEINSGFDNVFSSVRDRGGMLSDQNAQVSSKALNSIIKGLPTSYLSPINTYHENE